jgi:hypothetical protein
MCKLYSSTTNQAAIVALFRRKLLALPSGQATLSKINTLSRAVSRVVSRLFSPGG